MDISNHKEFYSVTDYIRIYYTPKEEIGLGFTAEIIEVIELSNDDEWVDTQKIGEVIAMFDGIRHLYLGENGEGYVYYPNLKNWIAIMQGLELLESKYCRDKQ